eukprot:3979839-Alexandrium_andersonii.AAC.1
MARRRGGSRAQRRWPGRPAAPHSALGYVPIHLRKAMSQQCPTTCNVGRLTMASWARAQGHGRWAEASYMLDTQEQGLAIRGSRLATYTEFAERLLCTQLSVHEFGTCLLYTSPSPRD